MEQLRAPGRCVTRLDSGLTRKHKTRLERPIRANTLVYKEHSQITAVKRFITLGQGLTYTDRVWGTLNGVELGVFTNIRLS